MNPRPSDARMARTVPAISRPDSRANGVVRPRARCQADGEMMQPHPAGSRPIAAMPTGTRERALDISPEQARSRCSTATGCAKNAACSASTAIPTPPRSPRSACTPCSIAARRRRASSAIDGRRFHSERRLGLVGDTFSRRDDRSTACPAPWRSAMCAIPPPARPSCATSSRCSPSSTPAASRSATTATSPMA